MKIRRGSMHAPLWNWNNTKFRYVNWSENVNLTLAFESIEWTRMNHIKHMTNRASENTIASSHSRYSVREIFWRWWIIKFKKIRDILIDQQKLILENSCRVIFRNFNGKRDKKNDGKYPNFIDIKSLTNQLTEFDISLY